MLQRIFKTYLICLSLGITSLGYASDNTVLGLVDQTAVHIPNSQGIVSSLDGSIMYVCSYDDQNIGLINTETQVTISPSIYLGATNYYPTSIAITSDGTRLCVGSTGIAEVSVIDTSTNTITHTVAVGNAVSSVAIKPDSMDAYVVNNGAVSVVNLADGTVTDTITDASFSSPVDIAINPSGTKAYVTNSNNSVTIIDLTDNTVPFPATVDDSGSLFFSPIAIAFSPDGTKAYVCNTASDGIGNYLVIVIDSATDTVIDSIIISDAVGALGGIVFSPDGSIAYVGAYSGLITSIYMINAVDNVYLGLMDNPDTVPTMGKYLALAQGKPLLYISNSSAHSIAYAMTFVTISSPASIEGSSQANVFFTQIDYINVITWTAPETGTAPASYNVYRNAGLTDLAGTVLATADPLQFLDTNRFVGVTYNYYVTSVDVDGNESAAINTSVTTQSV